MVEWVESEAVGLYSQMRYAIMLDADTNGSVNNHTFSYSFSHLSLILLLETPAVKETAHAVLFLRQEGSDACPTKPHVHFT